MLCSRGRCVRTVGTLVGPHNSTGKALACEPTSHFSEHPLTSSELATFFSSFSSRNSNPGFDFSSEFKARSFDNDGFDNSNNGYDRERKMGFEILGDLSFLGGRKSDCESDDSKTFGIFYDIERSGGGEEEEGSDDSDDGDDGDLTVLDSLSRVHEKGENFGRVEGDEEEFRHPLAREVCRLIEFRSGWNPKLEGELKNLLRSLKPRQVCTVLKSQSDERVALKFFYWADRQWRYKHHPVVYYAMLEVLSKTKLCQGAKRVLRLMACRGIERSPEAFGYVMVSYSRAGKLRHALRVLTLMQKAGVELDVSMSNTAIHVLVMGNKLEKALRVMERMQIIGITPNVVTYNCLMKGYCDVHRVVDALEQIDEMPKSGCAPDKVSYYAVMGSSL